VGKTSKNPKKKRILMGGIDEKRDLKEPEEEEDIDGWD